MKAKLVELKKSKYTIRIGTKAEGKDVLVFGGDYYCPECGSKLMKVINKKGKLGKYKTNFYVDISCICR